jgi:hypothetical protein
MVMGSENEIKPMTGLHILKKDDDSFDMTRK